MNWIVGSSAIAAGIFLAVAASQAGASQVPPENYEAPDFVGRDGCLYSKASIGGWEIWVQRLDDARRPVCGLKPSETGAKPEDPVGKPGANT